MQPNRNAASTANRSSRRGRPEPRSCSHRSARSLRFEAPWLFAHAIGNCRRNYRPWHYLVECECGLLRFRRVSRGRLPHSRARAFQIGQHEASESLAIEVHPHADRSASRGDWGRTAELDFAQGQRERHGGERDQHQDPEHVHVGEERRLRLHLLPDPLDGLLLCGDQRAALTEEVVRQLMQRVLILDARRDQRVDKPALMELLAMRQHVGGERGLARTNKSLAQSNKSRDGIKATKRYRPYYMWERLVSPRRSPTAEGGPSQKWKLGPLSLR